MKEAKNITKPSEIKNARYIVNLCRIKNWEEEFHK